jgi:hypothetical protein
MTSLISAKTKVITYAAANFCERLVSINAPGIQALTPPQGALSLMRADIKDLAVGKSLISAIQFILALNTLNYRFWDLNEGVFTRYYGIGGVGAIGMRAAFQKAWGADVDSTPATMRKNLSEKSIGELFPEIPGAFGRGLILDEIFVGDMLAIVAKELSARIMKGGGFTADDAALVAQAFPLAYGDPYLKKAQLAIAEIAGHCAEIGMTVAPSLTVFADYQVPRVLRALGVLNYSEELAHQVDTQTLIGKDSPEEHAIRSATIVAGEQIAGRFEVDGSVVDNYLWQQRAQAGKAPFHLTQTTDY